MSRRSICGKDGLEVSRIKLWNNETLKTDWWVYKEINSRLIESSEQKDVYFTKEIADPINEVFDKSGEIKDDASEELFQIRQQIKSTRIQINKNFDRELRKLMKDGLVTLWKDWASATAIKVSSSRVSMAHSWPINDHEIVAQNQTSYKKSIISWFWCILRIAIFNRFGRFWVCLYRRQMPPYSRLRHHPRNGNGRHWSSS